MGHVFAHASFHPYRWNLTVNAEWSDALQQIWPITDQILSWPPARRLTPKNVAELEMAFNDGPSLA